MEFVKQYIKVITYSLIGLAFAFASFYLLSNAYHYLEIRKDFSTDFNTQPLVLNINEKMSNVTKNVAAFNINTYQGNIGSSKMSNISSGLKSCIASFKNDTYMSMYGKKNISIIDVYNLRESYENDILGDCIVSKLYWTTTVESTNFNSEYLQDNSKMIKLYVDSLLSETLYLKNDLLNNSSYFYNTSIATSSVKNNTKDGFYEVLNAYDRAASFVEFVSEWFYNEVEGNYD